MSSPALAVFERLTDQVVEIRAAAIREVGAGQVATGPILLRACVVLTVAAFDTYIHEQGVRLLHARAAQGTPEADSAARYLGALRGSDLAGTHAEGLIRYRLSYRTLVAPEKVDDLLVSAGVDAEDLWLKASVALGSRPDRTRMQLQLQYDRRNQIAHEGDWDVVAVDFRNIEDAHVNDCTKCIHDLVREFDALLP